MSEPTPLEDSEAPLGVKPSDVLPRYQVFASLFTPSWMLGMMLTACLFLPSYRGCNGNVVRLTEALVLEEVSASGVYMRYLLTWPALFGLVVFAGTLLLVWSRNPERGRFLWWGFAGLIIIHTALLVVAILAEPLAMKSPHDWSWEDAWTLILWAVPSVGLPLLLVVTARCSTNWYHAAVWMQLALAFTAAVCSTYVIPALLLAKELLYGGKLMVTCSVGLVVSTIVQRLDGYRVLTRRRDDSSLQLRA